MNDYVIRPVEAKDMSEVIDLCALHAAYEKSSYDRTGKKDMLDALVFTERPDVFLYVVEKNGALLGYASVTRQVSTWDANHYLYLDCLYMREEARSQGIGAALMDHVKAEAKKLGCEVIQWQTPEFNTRAIKFYKRIGGKALKKERFFWAVD